MDAQAEPILSPELPVAEEKTEELPESSIYHCTQHEPVILSPIPPVVPLRSDEQQKTITALQQQLSQLANQFQAYITAVHGTNGSA